MEIKHWEILKSKYVFKTRWFKIRKDKVRLPDGTITPDYYVRERNDWCALFCLTEKNEFLLLKTYKHGSRCIIYELPSGSINESETPEQGIIREMLEETGYEVKKENLFKLGELLVDPTYTQAKMHLFFTHSAEKTAAPENNPKEISEVIRVPVKQADDFIVNNMKSFPESQVAAILLIKNILIRKGYIQSL